MYNNFLVILDKENVIKYTEIDVLVRILFCVLYKEQESVLGKHEFYFGRRILS